MTIPSQPNYHGYRFPPEIISHTVWLYHRFTLSLRNIEALLAEYNVIVSYESIRRWCATFGLDYARRLRKRCRALGDRWFLDEVTASIQGKRQFLWRAADQNGDFLNILVRNRKYKHAAQRFLSVHGQVHNLFRVGRHLLRAANYQVLCGRAFATWQKVTYVQ